MILRQRYEIDNTNMQYGILQNKTLNIFSLIADLNKNISDLKELISMGNSSLLEVVSTGNSTANRAITC